MLQANTSRGPSYHRPMSGSQTAASSVYSTASMHTAQQPAQAAAATAFIRAQERSGLGLDHRVARSVSTSQGGQTSFQQNNGGSNTMNVLKRRQSVRFVNRTSEKHRTTSNASIRILAEPRPGFATTRPNTPKTPTLYRPVSPFSYFGKGSSASEVQESSVSGRLMRSEYSIQEDDVLSSQSVHYGVRRSKSMFMPAQASDVFYDNGTPEKPPGPCYNYGNGISSVPMPRTQSRQIHLKTHKSMNFLGLMRNQASSGGRLNTDLQVQIARDKFLHQTNQQRLRDRPSFLFRVKGSREDRSGHSSSTSSEDMAEGISSWKESRLGNKARRAANKIRNRLRRVFGRSMKVPVEIPQQQVDATETHVREYSGSDAQDSSNEIDIPTSITRSEIRASLGSYNNMTIRLVPPTPRRRPVYQFSQDHEAQDVSYSESIYSRTTGSSSKTPEHAICSPTPPVRNDSQLGTGSAVILDTVTYHPTTPNEKNGLASCSDEPKAWAAWRGSEVPKLETSNGHFLPSTPRIMTSPKKRGYITRGHVRESAQIDGDDTDIAQTPVSPIKQPLGELQHNARFNPDLMPILKPPAQATSIKPLVENIGFNHPKVPPPPPPIQSARIATKFGSSRLAPSVPSSQLASPTENVTLPGSLADMVISSRNEGTSPGSCELSLLASSPTPHSPSPHASCDMHTESFTNTPNRSHERRWKLEAVSEPWSANETLRNMLVERGNLKRRISAMGTPIAPDLAADIHTGKATGSSSADVIKTVAESAIAQVENKDEDIYGVEGTGLMGPSIACRNIQLVGSLLSSRRSRITGCSESDSEDAFI